MKKKVLLIDDSVTIHRVIDLSMDFDKFDISKVFTGEDAALKLGEDKYDFILLDNKLDGINIADYVALLRERQPESRIILLVGAFDRFGENDLEKTGADDYLVKPFDSQSLNAKLNGGGERETGVYEGAAAQDGAPDGEDGVGENAPAGEESGETPSEDDDIMKTDFIERMPEADINRETDAFGEAAPAPLTGPAGEPAEKVFSLEEEAGRENSGNLEDGEPFVPAIYEERLPVETGAGGMPQGEDYLRSLEEEAPEDTAPDGPAGDDDIFGDLEESGDFDDSGEDAPRDGGRAEDKKALPAAEDETAGEEPGAAENHPSENACPEGEEDFRRAAEEDPVTEPENEEPMETARGNAAFGVTEEPDLDILTEDILTETGSEGDGPEDAPEENPETYGPENDLIPEEEIADTAEETPETLPEGISASVADGGFDDAASAGECAPAVSGAVPAAGGDGCEAALEREAFGAAENPVEEASAPSPEIRAEPAVVETAAAGAAEGGITISVSREEITAMIGKAIDKKILEETLKEVLSRNMEEIVRSIVPAMAEKYIKAEIERLKNDE